MTDKGYDNPPRTNGYDTRETGAPNGSGTALMLLEAAHIPVTEMPAGGVEADEVRSEETAAGEAHFPEAELPEAPPAENPETMEEDDAPQADGSALSNGHDEEPVQEVPPEFTDEERFRHLRMSEALLFASAEPLSTEQIAERLPEGADIEQVLADLADHYAVRGVNLVRVAGGWAFRTATDLSFLMERERVEQRKLSRAALETLAIIAYHQPVTRAEIEDVRGVSVSKGTLDVLMEIGWVRVRGRRQTPGRPVTYGTTDAFLEHFGLDRVSDLPGLDELKAAGLLDTRMPTNIHIPRPSDEDDPPEEDQEDEDTDLGFTPRYEEAQEEVPCADEAADDPEAEEFVPEEQAPERGSEEAPAKESFAGEEPGDEGAQGAGDPEDTLDPENDFEPDVFEPEDAGFETENSPSSNGFDTDADGMEEDRSSGNG